MSDTWIAVVPLDPGTEAEDRVSGGVVLARLRESLWYRFQTHCFPQVVGQWWYGTVQLYLHRPPRSDDLLPPPPPQMRLSSTEAARDIQARWGSYSGAEATQRIRRFDLDRVWTRALLQQRWTGRSQAVDRAQYTVWQTFCWDALYPIVVQGRPIHLRLGVHATELPEPDPMILEGLRVRVSGWVEEVTE